MFGLIMKNRCIVLLPNNEKYGNPGNIKSSTSIFRESP